MSNKTTAPIVAFTIELTMPTPRWMPNLGSNQPPNEGTYNSDNQITNETKTGSAH